MQKKWYVVIDENFYGPLNFEMVANLLLNRTILFVDYIYNSELNGFKRICEVGTFSEFLPKPPIVAPEMVERSAKEVNSIKDLIFQKRMENKVQVKSLSQLKERRKVTPFEGEVIIHDNFKVYHGLCYALSKEECFISCEDKHLPINKDLTIVLSSVEIPTVIKFKGRFGAISTQPPVGFCVQVFDMPPELQTIYTKGQS